jgi:hypothetical protein
MKDPAARTPSPVPSRFRGWLAFGLSFIPLLLFVTLGSGWSLALGAATTGWAAWVFVQAVLHPHVNLGKRGAFLGLLLSGATTYAAIGDVAQTLLWRRAFQLTPELALHRDPVNEWSVSYPALWGHQERNTGGAQTQTFRPSKMTPAMSFSVTCRPNVGTQDLALVVESFFMNLPKGAQTEILEKEPVTLPSGLMGYRIVYTELSRHIPLKSEILFVLDKGRLFFLSIQATPRWFDRHRAYLEKLLFSLSLAS